mgnify:CR=1 FL=1
MKEVKEVLKIFEDEEKLALYLDDLKRLFPKLKKMDQELASAVIKSILKYGKMYKELAKK